MADNIELTAGSGGAILATDEVDGVHYEWVKLAFGPDDTATKVTASVGLPVDVIIAKAEDAAHTDGDKGLVALAVRRDTAAVGSGTDGDYSTLNVNSAGRLYTSTTVDAALPAGTNNIGDVDVLTVPTPIRGPGNPVVDSFTSAAISASANTANQSVIAAPGANKQIWVYGWGGTADTGDGSIAFQDEDDTAKTGVMPIVQNGGFSVACSGNFSMPVFKVATNKALEIDTVTCGFKGWISYAIVDVS